MKPNNKRSTLTLINAQCHSRSLRGSLFNLGIPRTIPTSSSGRTIRARRSNRRRARSVCRPTESPLAKWLVPCSSYTSLHTVVTLIIARMPTARSCEPLSPLRPIISE